MGALVEFEAAAAALLHCDRDATCVEAQSGTHALANEKEFETIRMPASISGGLVDLWMDTTGMVSRGELVGIAGRENVRNV